MKAGEGAVVLVGAGAPGVVVGLLERAPSALTGKRRFDGSEKQAARVATSRRLMHSSYRRGKAFLLTEA